MSIQQLREERTAKAKEYRNILDANPGKLTNEEGQKLDELKVDIDALDSRISHEEEALRLEAHRLSDENLGENLKNKTADPTAKGLLNKWMRGGDNALTAEDWQHIQNTMSTTTDSQGGYTVESEVASSVLDALKEYGGMREACTVIRTDQGNPMNWPTSDGTSEVGEIVAENVAVSGQDVSFGTKGIPVYKYSSKVVAVPIELLQDTTIKMDSFVNTRCVTRVGRITNAHFTVGTGSNQPPGMIGAVSVGCTAAAAAAIAYTELTELEHSVDPAYRKSGSCRWMFSDTVLKMLKDLTDSQNRPLWLPDIAGNAPATILGYKYTINQDIAVPAASAKSIAFGDMSKYVIRDVMQLTYHRFTDSAYAKLGQVGFLLFMRSGGNYMDVGGAVKVLQQASS